MQLLLIVPLTIICMVWGLHEKNSFTPSGILLGVWALFMSAHFLLAPDYLFSLSAALLILILLLAFFAGEFISSESFRLSKRSSLGPSGLLGIHYEPSFRFKLRRSILFIGSLSLLGSLTYLWIFINHFGSFFNLLSAGWLIREEIGDGAISVPLIVRAFALLSYSGISLALVYWIRYGMRPFVALPFLGVLIMGIAQAARAGTFMLLITVFIGSYWRDRSVGGKNIGTRFIKRMFVFFSIILIIFVLGLMMREQNFSFNNDDFSQLTNFRIYAVGAISAFSVFLDKHNFDADLTWGRYSFASFFELIGLYKFASFGFYDEYLYISKSTNDYTNVYTIFRSLIEDFGVSGALFYMFSLGVITRAAYTKAMAGGLGALAFVLGMYTMFVYSAIAPITQHNSIIVSWILPPFMLWYMRANSMSKHREI